MRTGVMLFFIAAVTLIVYSNSLGGDFIWDDSGFVVTNDIIKNWRNWPLFFTRKEALASGELNGENYRPLVPLSYAMDYRLWGLNPLGYHAVNTAFHIFNALLVFWLCLLILKERYVAFLSSLLFALHPAQTEAVTWISGRSGVLSFFFFLLSLCVYIRYLKKKKAFLYFVSILCFAGAVFSREMAVTLPVLIVLYDYYFAEKERISDRALRYFPYFLILEVYIFLRFSVLGRMGQTELWGGTAYHTFLTMSKGMLYYVKLLVFPFRLCADYSNMPVSFSIFSDGVLPSAIVIGCLFAGAIIIKKYSRTASFFGLWFFIAILPAANIIPIKIIIAERFLYVPCVGFCVLVSMGLVRLYRLKGGIPLFRYLAIFASVLIMASYSARTYLRNEVWADEETFYKNILEYDPLTARAVTNLGTTYMTKNGLDNAMAMFEKAASLSPEFVTARINLALVYFAKEKQDEALKELDGILEIDPSYASAYEYKGLIYEYNQDYDRAIKEYKKALAVDPDYLNAYYDIGRIYESKGLYKKALAEYEKILRNEDVFHMRAFFAAVSLRIGEAYYALGEKDKALSQWNETVLNYPEQLWARELACFLTGKTPPGDFERQIEKWQPPLTMVGLYYLGAKSEEAKDYDSAREYYRRCIETTLESPAHIRLLAKEKLERLERFD